MNYKCSLFCSLYNYEEFIDGYIQDMLKQSIFSDIEFILMDCSPINNSTATIQSLVSKYNNIKYFRLESDPGLYAVWNIAIQKCSAPIIGNWNVDDRKSMHSTEVLYRAFEKDSSLDLVYGLTYVSTIKNQKYEDNDYSTFYPCFSHSLANLIMHNSPHCMPLWKKSLHDRFGYFDENYKTAADADMWLRSAVGGARIQMINHPVGLYYYNLAGMSTNPETLLSRVAEVDQMRQKYIHYLEIK